MIKTICISKKFGIWAAGKKTGKGEWAVEMDEGLKDFENYGVLGIGMWRTKQKAADLCRDGWFVNGKILIRYLLIEERTLQLMSWDGHLLLKSSLLGKI